MKARDRLISTAVTLIRRNGVAGTGLAALLQASGTARRSLYLNFPGGKAELIDAATATAGQAISTTIDRLAADNSDPVSTIGIFIAGWRAALADSGFAAGCPIAAAALGRCEAPAAADTAGAVFTDWQQRLTAHLAAARLTQSDAAMLAATTIAAVEGAILMCQATGSDEPLRHTEDGLITLYRRLAAA